MTKTNIFSRGAAKRLRTSGLYASASILPLIFVSGPALAQNAPTSVPDVNVQAPPPPPDLSPADIGTASAVSGGFYVPDQSFGPFGALPAKDIPFSTNSIPQKIIQDQQDKGLYEITRNDPTVTINYGANTQPEAINIRGWPVDYNWGYRQDGATVAFSGPVSPELLERVDLYKGLDGFLYGFVTPGGVVNSVTKRPLDTPLTRLTFGYTSSSAFEEALDFSRRFGPDNRFGIRVNLATENGHLPIQFQKIDRNVEGISLEYDPINELKIWGDFSHSFRQIDGAQAQLYPGLLASDPAYLTRIGNVLPDPPSLTRNYGQPWVKYYQESIVSKIGTEWKSSDWEFRGTLATSNSNTSSVGVFPAFLNTDGSITGTPSSTLTIPWNDHSIDAVLTRKFSIGPTEHRLSFGETFSDYIADYPGYPYNTIGTSFTTNFYNPVYVPEPVFQQKPFTGSFNNHYYVTNTVLSDYMKVGDNFGVIAGIARPTVFQHYSITSFNIDSYAGGRDWAPQGAIYFRPIPQLTAYASYVQSYQAGGPVNDLAASNNGTILPPYTSTQYEIGLKAELRPGLDVNAAVFQMREPSFYDQPTGPTTYIATENGEQKNEGLEVSVTGKITDNLKIFGGFMFLKTATFNTYYPNGSRAQGEPDGTARLFAEYAVPWVKGLTLTGGVFYTGQQEAIPGTLYIKPYTTLDLGGKYDTVLFGARTVARLDVNNATNRKYWAGYAWLGDPLTVKASLQFDLNWN